MLKKAFFTAILGITILTPASLLAADYLPKNQEDAGNVVVSGAEEYRNLYVAGGSVVVLKQILGDLFSAGGSVNLSGQVEKDLFAAGGNVTLSSPVGEDARIAGGNLVINAPIKGDALVAGGTVSMSSAATIGGDLWAAGGVLNLNGPVGGKALLAGGEIFINSAIAGPLEVWADDKLTFGPESRIAGTVVYHGRREAVVQEGAEVGQIQFERMPDREKYVPAAAGLGALFFLKIFGLLVAGLIILYAFREASLLIVASAHRNFWVNLGIGFIGFIAIPIIAVLLMVTLIGAYAGILLLACFGTAVLLSSVFGALLLGSFIEKWAFRQKTVALSWKTIVWGVLAGAVLSLIPVVGWLAMCILYVTAFGSMLRAVRERISA